METQTLQDLRALRQAFGSFGDTSTTPPPTSFPPLSPPESYKNRDILRIFDRFEYLIEMQDRRYMTTYIQVMGDIYEPLDVAPLYISKSLVVEICKEIIHNCPAVKARIDIRSIRKWLQ